MHTQCDTTAPETRDAASMRAHSFTRMRASRAQITKHANTRHPCTFWLPSTLSLPDPPLCLASHPLSRSRIRWSRVCRRRRLRRGRRDGSHRSCCHASARTSTPAKQGPWCGSLSTVPPPPFAPKRQTAFHHQVGRCLATLQAYARSPLSDFAAPTCCG